MARWRDFALAAALLAVAVAALLGPSLGASPVPGLGTTPGGRSPTASPGPSPTAELAMLTLAASDVVATTTPDHGTVLSVRLTARLRSTAVLMLRQGEAGPAITFRLTAPQSTAALGTLAAAPPATIPPGAAQAFALTFDLRGLSLVPRAGAPVAAGAPPAPGTWLLTVDLVDVAGMRHHAETPVTIAPAA